MCDGLMNISRGENHNKIKYYLRELASDAITRSEGLSGLNLGLFQAVWSHKVLKPIEAQFLEGLYAFGSLSK